VNSSRNGSAHDSDLAPVVERLYQAAVETCGTRWGGRLVLPSRDAVLGCVEGIRQVFFPGYFGTADLHDQSMHYYVGATLDRVMHELEEQIARAVAFAERHDFASCGHCRGTAEQATRSLLARLPEVRRLVGSDVEAAFEGDPALKIKDEAIFSYPGILAVTEQRIAHELYVLGIPLIPRIITEHAHGTTGIDIHPGASIGERFFIDHGTGVVVGESPPCPLPDAHAHGSARAGEPSDDARFRAEDPWPGDCDRARVHVGVFASHLERAAWLRRSGGRRRCCTGSAWAPRGLCSNPPGRHRSRLERVPGTVGTGRRPPSGSSRAAWRRTGPPACGPVVPPQREPGSDRNTAQACASDRRADRRGKR